MVKQVPLKHPKAGSIPVRRTKILGPRGEMQSSMLGTLLLRTIIAEVGSSPTLVTKQPTLG